MKKLITTTLLGILLFIPFAVSAQMIGFGGKVTLVKLCMCSRNYLVTITTPTPGMYIYNPTPTEYNPIATLSYMYQSSLIPMPLTSVWLLGNASIAPTATCWIPSGSTCITEAFAPLMIMVGASMPGV